MLQSLGRSVDLTGTAVPRRRTALPDTISAHASCRLDPPPEEVQRTFAALQGDPTVYAAMAGSSEFNITGSLKDWDITERLGELDRPTLVLSGRYDEATPRVVEPIAGGIPGAVGAVRELEPHAPRRRTGPLHRHRRAVPRPSRRMRSSPKPGRKPPDSPPLGGGSSVVVR